MATHTNSNSSLDHLINLWSMFYGYIYIWLWPNMRWKCMHMYVFVYIHTKTVYVTARRSKSAHSNKKTSTPTDCTSRPPLRDLETIPLLPTATAANHVLAHTSHTNTYLYTHKNTALSAQPMCDVQAGSSIESFSPLLSAPVIYVCVCVCSLFDSRNTFILV